MASFINGNVYTLMALTVLASVAFMASPGNAFSQVIEQRIGLSPQAPPAPSPAEYDDFRPGKYLSSPYGRHLRSCIKKVPTGCGPKILSYLFNEKATITSYCCQNMGAVGITCHKDMTRFIAGIPEFKGKQEQILTKATKIFDQCIAPNAF